MKSISHRPLSIAIQRLPRQIYAHRWRNFATQLFLLITVAMATGLFSTPTHSKEAVTHQSLSTLQTIARDFLQAQAASGTSNSVEIQLDRLDPRLHLDACETAPQAFLPAGSDLQGKLTVGVQCPGEKPWTVYIPANIQIFAEILTTSRPISRGDMITAADLIARRQEISKLKRGYYRQREDVIGKLAARSLPAGTPLSPRMLKAQLLVRRGDDVTILASVGSLQVRSKGTALQNAAMGERISVRNTRSKRIIEGVAIKPGTIQVHM